MKKHEIFDIIFSAISEVSPSSAAMLSASDKIADSFFVDIGINSIEYAEIAYLVMNRLNVSQPIDIFTGTNRISDVVEILHKLKSQDNRANVSLGENTRQLNNGNLATAF